MIPVSYNLRNLTVRKTTTASVVLGLALVVFVFASVMMLSNGIKKTLGRASASDVAVVLRKGSLSELESSIDEPHINLALNDRALPLPAKGPRGIAEIVTVILLDKVGTDGMSNVTVRGVGPDALAFRPTMTIIEGRAARPGSDEVLVGKSIRGRFLGLTLDQSFELKKNRPVKVVGIVADNGSSYESEVWADINTVRTAFNREGFVSSIRARVEPSQFDAYKASIEANRQLNVQVLKEADFFDKQSEGTALFISAMGIVIAVFFSFGAMLGAMITMHAAVASRQREIGTLRALGFSKFSILFSFLLESIFLSLVGGAIGAAGSMAMGLVKFSMMNFASWSEIVFSFEPTVGTLVSAMIFASIMGLIGGILPAIRASRVSPVDAMRA